MNKKMNERTLRYLWYGITTILVILATILIYVTFGPLSSATYDNCAKYKCMVVVNGSSCRLEYKDYICDCELDYSTYEYAKYEIDCYVNKTNKDSCPTDDWRVCRDDTAFVWLMICMVLAVVFTLVAILSICQSCMCLCHSKNTNQEVDLECSDTVDLECSEEHEYLDAVELECSEEYEYLGTVALEQVDITRQE